MSEMTCKCGHAVSDHVPIHGCFHNDHAAAVCECRVTSTTFYALHHAIVEAAMRYEDGSEYSSRKLFAAVRALREATQP